ncbi:MAG TPA: hypothetical protein VNQ90_06815 [Chthoniobacteraceae bacterium]|nr:hypothetical protein [Chthoniobacteraceae bacterium]
MALAAALLLPACLLADSTEQAIDDCLHITRTGTATRAEKVQLLAHLDSPSRKLRSAAVVAWGTIRTDDPVILKKLEAMLDDPARPVRACAASALLKLTPEGPAIFRRRLADTTLSTRSRMEAVMALRSSLEGLRDPVLRREADALLKDSDALRNPPVLALPDSPLQNGLFDESDPSVDWTFEKADGAVGRITFDPSQGRTAPGSLKIEKSNATGELRLWSKRRLKVASSSQPTLRFYYRSDDAPATSALQLYLVNENGERFIADHSVVSITAESQTMVRNAPPGQWNKRVTIAPRSSQPGSYRLLVTLKGSPCTVWIDDLAAPAAPYAYTWPEGTESMPEPTPEQDKSPAGDRDKPVSASARLVQQNGRSRLTINGKAVPPVLYFTHRGNLGDYAGMEKIGGVRLMVSTVNLSDTFDQRFQPTPAGWKHGLEFDFSTSLQWLDHAARNAPESLLIINLKVSWPADWVDRHPEEAWMNAIGQRGHGNALRFGGFDPELPNTPNARWWPSPSSLKAREEAGVGIRQLAELLKKKPYYHRIAGCFVSGGHDGQFFTAMWPDYSVPATTAFREWLRERYSSDEALQDAWDRSRVTLDTADVPDYRQLLQRRRETGMYFLDPSHDRAFVDHQEFQAEQGFRIRESLAHTFKEALGRDTVGMTWQLGGGLGQGAERLFLRGNDVDMMVTQPTYSLRQPGNAGGLRAVLGSLSLHRKLSIKELDLRTWLRTGGDEIQAMRLGAAMTPGEFRTTFRKEVAEMIASGHGYWLFDIVPVHFRDPAIMETVAESIKAYQELELNNPTPFRPDVALVRKDDNAYWLADTMNAVPATERLEFYTPAILKQSGVPYDTLFLSDLLATQAERRYKVVILFDAYRLTAREREAIEKTLKKDQTTVVWNYAPGYLSDAGLSVDALSSLTGMTIAEETTTAFEPVRYLSAHGDPLVKNLHGLPGMGETAMTIHSERVRSWEFDRQLPRFHVTDPAATPLAAYRDGKTAIAIKRFPQWTSIYLGMAGALGPDLLNRIATEAKAAVLTSPDTVLDFNGRFLSLHGLRNGPVTVHLPHRSKVFDFDTGKLSGEGKNVTLNVEAGETRWFKVEPATKPASDNLTPRFMPHIP